MIIKVIALKVFLNNLLRAMMFFIIKDIKVD
jgi:hypothetical protein